jgi:hypothetical protein
MEVYERMIREDERTAPELVISGPYLLPSTYRRILLKLIDCILFLPADTIIIYPPQSDLEAVLSDQTTTAKSSTHRLTGLNTNITSAEESEDLGEGERQGEGKRDELSWGGRKGGISKILEKPMDKNDQVSWTFLMLDLLLTQFLPVPDPF